MSTIGITYTTSDKRTWAYEASAKEHQALIDRIDQFLDDHGIGESRRAKLRKMFVDWECLATDHEVPK